MIPSHFLQETITVWNLLSKGITSANVYQRTVIDNVFCRFTEQRILDNNGLVRIANVMTVYINEPISIARDNRKYVDSKKFEDIYAKTPENIVNYFTLKAGFDFIGVGEVSNAVPSNDKNRKDYKIMSVRKRRTPDGRAYLKVSAE
jgi:hypothetical protein